MLHSGERQVSNDIYKIRQDHTGRYFYANKFIKPGHNILDAMCGVGYGSYMMAATGMPEHVVGFDIDYETIEYAKKWYKLPNIEFHCHSYEEMDFIDKSFDLVTCYEAIEHINKPLLLLTSIYMAMKDDGVLLLSTPNGAVLPHDPVKFPEHVRHYTSVELEDKLITCGFKVERWLSQHSKNSMTMNEDLSGKFMIAVCRKDLV